MIEVERVVNEEILQHHLHNMKLSAELEGVVLGNAAHSCDRAVSIACARDTRHDYRNLECNRGDGLEGCLHCSSRPLSITSTAGE